jgi:hypothetical protein
LVASVVSSVATHEQSVAARKKARRDYGIARQRQAVGAIIGGLLRHWGREAPQAVYRSRRKSDFTGGRVPSRQYLAACDALVALGLVEQSRSVRYGTGIVWDEGSPEHFAGWAPRLWPTQALLDAAVHHGVMPATLETDFDGVYPSKPPAVLQPVQMFTLKTPRRNVKALIAIRRDDAEAARLIEKVTSYNAWIAEHAIAGCLPPRLKRVFTASWLLHGRWYAVGNEGCYQRLPEARRLKLTINGEAVAEVDVRASHLSIMHGLLGLQLPDGDPYEFPEVPRSVAKAWITATLGKGTAVTKWAIKAAKDHPKLLRHDPREVGAVICDRFPFLRRPAEAVAKAAGLDKLAHIGTPARLLTHRLMSIEAQALTGAMEYVKGSGALALPTHDGLLVPVSAVRYARAGLDGAYSWAANRVRVTCTVEVAPDMPRAESTEALQRPTAASGTEVPEVAQESPSRP